VAWRALDDCARRTWDTLVQLALARQPLPEVVLALEVLESNTGTTPISLSAISPDGQQLLGILETTKVE
jgi:hypothetical protein